MDNKKAADLVKKLEKFYLQPCEGNALSDEEFKYLLVHTRKLINMLEAYPNTSIITYYFWSRYHEYESVLRARYVDLSDIEF